MPRNLAVPFKDRSIEGGPPQPGAQPDRDTCIANISPSERRKRLLWGGVTFVAGIAILALLIGLGMNPLWRIGLFVPFFGAGVGFFQWRDKT